MKTKGEDTAGIDIGSFVMNYHHGLLRFGIVQAKRKDEQGWAQYTVDWLEDEIHDANAEWVESMTGTQKKPTEYRADWIKPVSVTWLKKVLNSYLLKKMSA
tara:strand:+ start:184 stop:486 length:303 start_codon:yes stop_codon:yes gene_type:complete